MFFWKAAQRRAAARRALLVAVRFMLARLLSARCSTPASCMSNRAGRKIGAVKQPLGLKSQHNYRCVYRVHRGILMSIIKASLRIIIGVLFGIGSAIALIPAFAAFTTDQDTITPIIMMALVLSCGVLCLFAPTIRRALGRGFLLLGASVFALPISAFLLSGRAASEVVNSAE